MRHWQALSEQGQPSARRDGHLLEVRYRPAPGVPEELEALAAAKRKCCLLLAWDVTREEDHGAETDCFASVRRLAGRIIPRRKVFQRV